MSIPILLTFLLGLAFLIIGAEALVRGASRLAAAIGISPLVIGLTIVAFGTSSPELAVSIQANFTGQAEISLGNVVGSNIFNILFILGISAAITPLIVSHQLIRLDIPIMIAASILLFIFGLDGIISRFDGAVFSLGIVIYTLFLYYQSRKAHLLIQNKNQTQTRKSRKDYVINVVFILVGFVMLIIGSQWLVEGAVYIAQLLGISQLVIGLTVVAVGTSLPEVATSIVAAIRGERDIAVGNIVGSNIFNILVVVGITSLVTVGGIAVPKAALWFDIPVMIAISFACLPIFFTGYIIARWEGFLFLSYYLAYTTFLILESTRHKMLSLFSTAMLLFIIPITVITLIILTWRSIRSHKT
jgi:cation:H+ antiporter